MPQGHAFNPVYRSINKPLTICGAARKLFVSAALMRAGSFSFCGSLLSGLLMLCCLFICARWATVYDPQIVRILLNSAKFRCQYDPAKCAHLPAERAGRHD